MISISNVRVCEYGGDASDLLCIEPRTTRRQHPSWIMWIDRDGSAQVWTQRTKTGAVIGEPINLPANVSRSEQQETLPPVSFKQPGWPECWSAEALREQERLIRRTTFERGFRQNPPSEVVRVKEELEEQLNCLSLTQLAELARSN